MARRADWDYDDDFEVLNRISPSETFEVIESDPSFEIVSCNKTSPPLVNTTPIQPVTIIEKPVPPPIPIDKPIVNEVKQPLENSPTNFNSLPIRYGSAAVIPYDDGFDLKSILNRHSALPTPTNDLISILREDKSTKSFSTDQHLQEFLLASNDDHQRLIQAAKQASQDFLNAIRLD